MLQYTLLEGSGAMWQSLHNAHQHGHIARHFWVICHDSSVTVCIDLNSVSGDFFHCLCDLRVTLCVLELSLNYVNQQI